MRKPIVCFISLLLWLSLLPAEAQAPPLKVCLVSGSAEYDSDTSLAAFQKHLEERYSADCTLIKARGFEELPGLEALDDCDVALFFTRRLRIVGEELARVKKYCTSGKPIVAVRTSSHGFQNWLEFDNLVLGGNYHGHFGGGPTTQVTIDASARGHPVLDEVVPVRSRSSLYRTAPLAEDCQLLMTGSIPGQEGSQPVAWSRSYKGARVVYTSLGAPRDFENATFRRLLANALFWAARRQVERKALPPVAQRHRPEGTLRLPLRTRVQTFKASEVWDEVIVPREFPVAETAILICDMWDEHWCRGATERCGAMAEKMAPVVNAARAKGVQIIHCPSETMYFYADSLQRRRMMIAPPVPLPKPLPLPTRKLPIDASDGGCDTEEKPWHAAWTQQNPRIEIGEYDGITDSGEEVYYFLRQLGIKNLIVMGVHTNMCVLGRSFGIRQMTRWGIRCILVRDLTDAMYDPKDPPFVSHDEGTQLVVRHIESYWCPSILSTELVKGLP